MLKEEREMQNSFFKKLFIFENFIPSSSKLFNLFKDNGSVNNWFYYASYIPYFIG
jgi:hypothetical protein